ncbi:MAG: hypothetical protein A3C30_02980 [Candidatus Levybacteria bacterium RIFCSPHIGHO2_02_FULL_40_18]|nr:MAG: hypothetical protein A2869_05000 [Candidatus Levybacteria bacterium RIFCSPHIGHO2_01_FULL_40_58]OGH26939.1 MAG: hypothetical protein A3C30_02980 [Candidatus Levybacteria bacterium RIFCSPHIGHO2_02_FULL_40_18]OGH32061.1 MAG: hypothetical protein A3E43_03960 [Candidatus Levybacteria bacterium RIFCSPHIGHO2_12_FULL_40_31]OGH40817.1 MAG: hypothetical protein A2894_04440 [Candidatus Levybacteria bacterium RIFCSPLOWO2_01_FULL_40_64]OGH48673.1 MAG: hypothetical protein A3I54_03370 [Candidatus Lev
MDEIYVNIADFNILIKIQPQETTNNPPYDFIRNRLLTDLVSYLGQFIILEKPGKVDFEINFIEAWNLQILRVKSDNISYIPLYEEISSSKFLTYFLNSIYQFQLILKYAVHELLDKSSGFLIHSSAVKINNKAYFFLGKSAAGKSTIATMLADRYPKIADDTSLVKKEGNQFFFYQTPFFDKNWVNKHSERLKMGKMFFLKKANFFKVEKIEDKEQILNYFLKGYVVNLNKISTKNVLKFVNKFDNFYMLYFAKNPEKTIRLIESLK